ESTKTANNSAGPKNRAWSATCFARNVNSTVAMNAPTSDDRNDEVSARPGLPFRFASGNPSNKSTTDHGSPGMLKRIDVMAPPKSAPQYRDVRRMIAEVGGIVNVSGSRMATPLAPPSPGSTPMMVPSVMPTTASNRLKGEHAIEKPQ